jgi:hypothetical protein
MASGGFLAGDRGVHGEELSLAWRKSRARGQRTAAWVEAVLRRRGGRERHGRSNEGKIIHHRALSLYSIGASLPVAKPNRHR